MTPEDFKAWRLRLRLTQQRAAALLGIDRRTISRHESGTLEIGRETERACATLETVLAACANTVQFLRTHPATLQRNPAIGLRDWREATARGPA